ncbi:putative triphosphatase YjbK [Oceanobacillus oncorhynchi subsp. incaldanensis]|uniref:CYTH domain protein n=2 Tax=Oceanobacillus TaxID=182709 RepID=A0A0A1MYT3_9BACI|nr:CYTH domain-containing protein [Oceanobacillus oncorhynchi]MDM8102457.1 CYTH domain-containing protein [Oceanobacillus oncorhynchi]UUI38829.1 CYTH domain-containing protein [Oceanobacillus oncorhynchi]GIO20819.1 putative triphosphatase YjbK [Oceanobacillus oncorhynchi subsp. incaldanensis]CEI84537.1 CYTH domain protein [Oceanobacillus oncorhynchi]
MSQEVEIEFKNLLTTQEYNQLAEALFSQAETIEQTNYYFETPSFDLKGNHSALRIRKKNETYTLTLKEPHPDGLLETHDKLSEEAFLSWTSGSPTEAPNVLKQLQEMSVDVSSLTYLGKMTTLRKERPYQDTLIVLDKSMYLDAVDAELELEAASRDHGEKVFKSLLGNYEIPFRETPAKIARFFNQKQ